MLNRMDYLATQSANGTYDDPVDRFSLQREVNQLKDEINRIADSDNFNGIKLLDGSLAAEGGSAATSVGKIEGVNVIDIDPAKSSYTSKTAIAALTGAAGDKHTATVSLAEAEGKAAKEITLERRRTAGWAWPRSRMRRGTSSSPFPWRPTKRRRSAMRPPLGTGLISWRT
jgi:flagellin